MKARIVVVVVVGAALAAGCSTTKPKTARQVAFQSGLTVSLRWNAPVDLDLYLTDPLGETVYFAKRTTRSGLQLDSDTKCKDGSGSGLSTEKATNQRPLPGRYRVSVDFSDECGKAADKPVEFEVRAHAGSTLETLRGLARPQRLETSVMEFDVGDAPLALQRVAPSGQPTTVLPAARPKQ